MGMILRPLLSSSFSGLLVVVLVTAMAPAVYAQQSGEGAEPPPPQALEEAASAEAEVAEGDPEGWDLLSRAVEQLARGDEGRARALLEQLATNYPDHPASTISADALAVLTSGDTPAPDAPVGSEKRTSLARAELAFLQTVHGIALGAEFCFLVDCDGPQPTVLALGAGGGLGLALSLLGTPQGITPGHALALNSGTAWGLANGALLSVALDIDGADAAGLYAASQLAGLGAGALVWGAAEPTAGDVSMANSGGLWTGFLTFMAHVAAEFEAREETVALSVLLGADLGIVGGALLSQHTPMSRGRTFVIDSGGILGFLIGVGTYVLVEPDVTSATAISLMGIGGAVTGLGTATYLTRNWDVPEEDMNASWTVAPTDGGAMLSIGGSF